MKIIILAGLLLIGITSLAQTENIQKSALKPSSETYTDVNSLDRAPQSVDPGSGAEGIPADDGSQKMKTLPNSQNMPVDQD